MTVPSGTRASRRIPEDLTPSPWAEAVRAAQLRGPLLDLTSANPHDAGLVEDALQGERILLEAAAPYLPHARGLLSAREAIAAEYASRGLTADPERILITASTSESWSLLFKALCDPGDAVLVPRPGYPLIETLAPLDGVVPVFHDLDPATGWGPTAAVLKAAWTPGTRIVASISPANPTGRILRRAEQRLLEETADRSHAVLVADEVFSRYPLGPPPLDALPSALLDPHSPTVVLDGVSKSCGLPGAKIGWMVVTGPSADEILARLEHVNDAYLSASAPAQAALPAILAAGTRIRAAIQSRVAANLVLLRDALDSPGASWMLEPPEAGWTAVLRCRSPIAGTGHIDPAEQLLARGLLVHPGWLFDLPENRIVVSLLSPHLEVALPRFS